MAASYTKLSYPRSVEKTGYYLNFYAYDYNKAQSLGVKSIRDILSGASSKILAGNNTDFMQNLSIEDQQRITSEGSSGWDGTATFDRSSDIPANSSLGCVKLYIPSSLEYKYSANWNKISFGALGAAFGGAGAAIGAAGATGLNSLFDNFLKGALEQAPATDNLTAGNILGGAFGITFNDNTMQTFEKMNVREFNFDYVMAARNSSEERDIKDIIKFFKMGMHPGSRRSGTNNSLFLEYPYIFRIVQSGKKDVSQFLPQTKYCALVNVTVNYTPDNVLALTPNNFVQAVRLTLSFSEMTTLTRQDIHEIEDTASAEEFGWIEAQERGVDVSSVIQPRRPTPSDFSTSRSGKSAYRNAVRNWDAQYGG